MATGFSNKEVMESLGNWFQWSVSPVEPQEHYATRASFTGLQLMEESSKDSEECNPWKVTESFLEEVITEQLLKDE